MRLDPRGTGESFPKRANLPHIAGTPPGSAWFWGGHDELGRLNLLTPERIREATRENVSTGQTVSLNLPLNFPHPPIFGRKQAEHQIQSIGPNAFDDHISFNTQSSTQWDGFRHFADPTSGSFYNGVTAQEILPDDTDAEGSTDSKDPTPSRKLGIDAWARHGIVGRAVLLDVAAWAEKQGTPFDPFSAHHISAADLRACAAAQNTALRTADILLVRTGWTRAYRALSLPQRAARAALPLDQHAYAGLEPSDEMKDFLHDGYFVAAASDNPSLETWPSADFARSLHACMLPLWGMPIGELWDLDELARVCEREGRWSFLLVSVPLGAEGGVAAAPNAVAMF